MQTEPSAALPLLRVSAAVLRRADQVLLAQRGAQGGAAHLWEFPGGKIEPDETPAACLARELTEELGIRARIGPHLHTSRTALARRVIELVTHEVTDFDGEPRPITHARLVWVPLSGLAHFVEGHPMPAPDLPVLRLLIDAADRAAPPGR